MKYTVIGLLLLVVVLAGCSGTLNWLATQNQTSGHAEAGLDGAQGFDTLAAVIEAQGLTIETVGTVSQPFFEVEGQIMRINGIDVQVFEFADTESAEMAASTIAPDGSSVGTSMMMWVEPPHFYHSGRLIVLYVGSDEATLSLLATVLGGQIAGR